LDQLKTINKPSSRMRTAQSMALCGTPLFSSHPSPSKTNDTVCHKSAKTHPMYKPVETTESK